MANNALVTGGSRGIGKSISIKLAAMGYHVLINYNSNLEAAQDTLAQIEAAGGSAELLAGNVADSTDFIKRLGEWQQAHPGEYISCLVNNAGIRRDNLMIMMPDQDWECVIDTNLNSTFYITKFLLKSMLLKRNGRIINVASLSGLKGLPGQVNYSAAKAALIGITKALAQEVGKRNITVNAVAPGFIETDMTKDLDHDELTKNIPAGRFGKPEEVAALVGFLASPDAAYITGQVISINGGLYT